MSDEDDASMSEPNGHALVPGTRVQWAEHDPGPSDYDPTGTVVEPTAEELAYVATWARSLRAEIAGHVIVQWDGEEPPNRAWHDPEQLREVQP